MTTQSQQLDIGLGLRQKFILEVADKLPSEIDWFEVAPENYIDRGGEKFAAFEKIHSRYPIIAHGLSLSIGSLDELNWEYLKKLKKFIRDYSIPWFSDHLCFSSYQNHYYHDLLPLPFTKEAVNHLVPRIKVVQDFLEVPFALENISYYLLPDKPEMTEAEFLIEVLSQAQAPLMLDVNNIYVNAFNHGYSASEFLATMARSLPIQQLHIAGHYQESEDLIIDTHGADVPDPVWELLRELAGLIELPPVLVERDHEIPSLENLIREVELARGIARGSPH